MPRQKEQKGPSVPSKSSSPPEKNILEGATDDRPWSPKKPQLISVAVKTKDSTLGYQETVGFLKSKLVHTNGKWRYSFKALVVVEYLLYFGDLGCIEWALENLDLIRMLEQFDHNDKTHELKVRYAAKQVSFLLSDPEKLRREREDTTNWKSIIPEMNSPKDSFKLPAPTQPTSNQKSRATDASKITTPSQQRSQKGPMAKNSPLASPGTADRLFSTVPITETTLATREKNPLPKPNSQEFCNSRGQFPDAQDDFELRKYFDPMECRPPYTDAQCQDIARLLREGGNETWSRVPRIYIILRLIGGLDVLDRLIDQGITDLSLPFPASSLSRTLSSTLHPKFKDTQELVLTQGFNLEKSKGHGYFTRDQPLLLESTGQLGQGGFGTVDKVKSSISNREYARKRFRRKELGDAELKSFRNEVQNLQHLDHPHCVELIFSYTDQKYFGIIMRPVAEYNLEEFYASSMEGKAPLLRSFFGCLAGALEYLHRIKIRHRDIKPKNILVYKSHVYLTDFGISLNWQKLSKSTTTKDSGKTTQYCAPEVARVESRNTSAEVWSLGCVFLEMLTVIKGRTVEEQRENFKQQHARSDNFYENISAISEWIRQIRRIDMSQKSDSFIADCILQMLKENPAERPLTEELYYRISNHQDPEKGKGNPICGECCIPNTFSDSDSSSDMNLVS